MPSDKEQSVSNNGETRPVMNAPLDELIGGFIRVTRPTRASLDCDCGAIKRLAHEDHSPACAYYNEVLTFEGVLWQVHATVDEGGEQVLVLEGTSGSVWSLDTERDDLEIPQSDQQASVALSDLARLQMVARASGDLVISRRKLLQEMDRAKEEHGQEGMLHDARVERAGRRSEEAMDRLVAVIG